MTDMIAFCGLNCTQCPMFIATQNDDDKARAEAADMLDKTYGLKYAPEEIPNLITDSRFSCCCT